MSLFIKWSRERHSLSAEQIIARGREAQGILDSGVFQSAMEESQKAQIMRWRGEVDPKAKDACWAIVNAIDEVERVLHGFVNDAEVAKHSLEK